MRNWKVELLNVLKGHRNNEIKLLNSWCKKKGFDFRKTLLDYRRYETRLLDFQRGQS